MDRWGKIQNLRAVTLRSSGKPHPCSHLNHLPRQPPLPPFYTVNAFRKKVLCQLMAALLELVLPRSTLPSLSNCWIRYHILNNTWQNLKALALGAVARKVPQGFHSIATFFFLVYSAQEKLPRIDVQQEGLEHRSQLKCDMQSIFWYELEVCAAVGKDT